jgi:hypothetical protein
VFHHNVVDPYTTVGNAIAKTAAIVTSTNIDNVCYAEQHSDLELRKIYFLLVLLEIIMSVFVQTYDTIRTCLSLSV